MERKSYNIAEELMCFKTQVHMFHLTTKSYAEHKALDFLYDNIDVDGLLETYIGTGNNLLSFVCKVTTYVNLEEVKKYIEEKRRIFISIRNTLPTELQNMIDELLGVIDKTNYLLTLK